ncbi:MAG: PIN domain-containing protein [Rhodospirillaceae bacterium]|nr:PIN domain-containing protein [Rhodospirillaceae bacterium]
MMSKFTVIFDACVLYPAPLRDLLIQLACAELFRAKWTDTIHEEWISSLLGQRPDLSRESLEHTKRLMNQAVLDCLVEGYEGLIDSISLPDKQDRHVVAAAIHGRCDAIVTLNLKDFPQSALNQYQLQSIHPDDFISYQFDLDKAAAVIAAQKCRSRLNHPAMTADEYLDVLMRQSLTKTVKALRPYASIL